MTARALPDDVVAELGAAGSLVLLIDVDGTLAPIAPRPEDARVPQATRVALSRLAASAEVVVVSGRAVANAQAVVAIDRVWAIGNHGVERLTPEGRLEVDPRVASYEQRLAGAAVALRAAVQDVPGAWLEDKRWSQSVHYRQVARDAVPALVASVHDIIERHGLRPHSAKEVVEVRVPVEVDKGTAVLDLLRHLGVDQTAARVMYVGDDVTDEDAFRRLRAAMDRVVTVHVGREGAETAAEYRLADPQAVGAMLERLADLRESA